EDAMMELAIALSLQESGQDAGANQAAAAAALNRPNASQALRYLRELNQLSGNADENALPQRREHRPLPSVSESSQPNEQPAGVAGQHQQQADYVMLHSESDEDDEDALFDDEMKLADATVESIDVEE